MPALPPVSPACTALLAALPGYTDHLLALLSEQAVREALAGEGHHLATFSVWALRRRTRRKDPIIRIFFQPKDWTWLVFSSSSPHDLTSADEQLLLQLCPHLHGVVYVQWALDGLSLQFTTWSLRVTMVGTRQRLLVEKPARKPPVTLSPVEHQFRVVTNFVPEALLLPALVEAYYVEHLEAADRGAFTNIDVLAWDGERPIAVEVKRRSRLAGESREPIHLTATQTNTLYHLRQAGGEIHLAALLHPPEITKPDAWLPAGHWRSGGHAFQPRLDWVEAPIGPPLLAPTLSEFRRSRAEMALPIPPPVAPAQPKPEQPEGKVQKAPPQRPVTPSVARVKPAPRLTSFTGPYAFLEVWASAPIRVSGRLYQNAAAAFLAARTLDQEARERLTTLSTPPDLLRVARRTPVREDWLKLRETVAREVYKHAYRGERVTKLVQTLPYHLADEVVFDPALVGLQGRAGLYLLEQLRGKLAEQSATQMGPCCGVCRFAAPARAPGFMVCRLATGQAGTLACVGKAAYQGLGGGPLRVAVTTPAGIAFQPRSEETLPGW